VFLAPPLLLSLTPSFFLTHPPPTETPPLSLHDALPISTAAAALAHEHALLHAPRVFARRELLPAREVDAVEERHEAVGKDAWRRSEEHTSELQSLTNLVCRLLLEKKNTTQTNSHPRTPA